MGNREAIRRLGEQIRAARRQPSSLARSQSVFLSELLLARLEQGLTQSQLAKRSGLQQSAIARTESGQTSPSLKTLLKISEALDVNLVLEYKHGKNLNHR